MDCWSMVDEMLEVARPDPPDLPPNPDRPPVGFMLVSNQASFPGIANVVGVAYGFLWYRPERTIQQGGASLREFEALAGQGRQLFSDRQFTYGTDNREAGFDPEHTDNIRVIITRSVPRLAEVEIELLSWGNHRFNLRDLRCEAGVMFGVGDGVGPSIREALYVLSVRAIED
jgi:hypothetical protein